MRKEQTNKHSRVYMDIIRLSASGHPMMGFVTDYETFSDDVYSNMISRQFRYNHGKIRYPSFFYAYGHYWVHNSAQSIL